MKKPHQRRAQRSILEYAVLTAVGFLAFRAAYASRGGGVPGGELIFLALPLLWHAAKRTAKDLLEDIKQDCGNRLDTDRSMGRDGI